ncbi:MAG: response regulator [Desulfovibrionaceae bacterium]|nr:response regulator [Desulfovibrionaceae bacterium]
MSIDMPLSILIVDDVPANLQLLSGMLTERGYKVRPAPSGPLALEAARRNPPELILLDINMPQMDGFEVCRRLKADPNLADIPVLFISALGDAADKVRAFAEGGQDYITKPFHVEEVLARVMTHLALRRAQREVKEQNRVLLETLDQLKKAQNRLVISEKMAALGVLAAGVAHEINNPLNFVKTSCHGLEKDLRDLTALVSFCRDAMPDGQREALAAFERQVDYATLTQEIPELLAHVFEGLARAGDIVSSLQVFSRTDDAVCQDVDINDVVESVLVVLRNRYKNVTEMTTTLSPTPRICGNPGKLGQVVMNLITNAIDAVESVDDPALRRITLATETCSRNGAPYVALHVTDSGPGIPPDIQCRIFDPFFTTKPVGRGTGLGLFISNNLIQEHRGALELASVPGRETTFSMYLPAPQEDAA